MNHTIFQKLEKMNGHCKTCAKAYALLTLLSLVTFFIYFFNHFTLETLYRPKCPITGDQNRGVGTWDYAHCLFFFKYIDKKLQIYGLDSNNLNEYIQRNQAFFQKY
jgi:hypothetical protein